MKRSQIFIVTLLLACFTSAFGEVQVNGRLDRSAVVVGESATLTITIEGAGSVDRDPAFKTPEGLRIRDAGQGHSYSLVNGRFSQSLEIRYSIVALRAGRYEIGPIEIEVSDRAYTIGPFALTAGDQGRAPQQRPGTDGQAQDRRTPPVVLVEMDVEPKEVFVGQQVTLTTTFYQRADVSLRDASFIPPETEGFWKEDLPPNRRGRRVRGGARYEITEILTALFPTRSGELTITPARVSVRYREPGRRGRDPFFPFGLSGREREAEPSSKPCKVNVVGLPQPAPAGFTGAVGEFRLTAKADRSEVMQGEPITWTIEISGRGNVSAIEAPEFPEIPGCRGFDAGSDVNRAQKNDVVGGKKTVSRVLIPEAAGSIELPEIGWTYFDPQKKRYISETAPALKVTVTPALQAAGSAGGRLGGAIRGIRPESRLSPLSAARPWTNRSFWLLQLVPLCALVIGYGLRQRRLEQERDPARMRLRLAPRRLRASLKSIEADTVDPWGKLAGALESFLADRYGERTRGMTRDLLSAHLVEQGASSEVATQTAELLEKADEERYAPGETGQKAELREAIRRAADCAARLSKRSRRG